MTKFIQNSIFGHRARKRSVLDIKDPVVIEPVEKECYADSIEFGITPTGVMDIPECLKIEWHCDCRIKGTKKTGWIDTCTSEEECGYKKEHY